MPIHPGMVEDLSAGARDLYADGEARLLGMRQTLRNPAACNCAGSRNDRYP
ncbi:hypothetical protein OG735_25090 [Streptomyces sp. NBC_01210]|uniref:hypothetical protein n=1 Tax=Streptomyces sp. NBC_01210 TaxID=2903774 RepID=UPI002E124313|nr:hypothetical protein OG735_25090 [Streptomyces sp. NBC_01210]